jgi:hypothetical protein
VARGGCAAGGPLAGRGDVSPTAGDGVVGGCEASGREGGPMGTFGFAGAGQTSHEFLIYFTLALPGKRR